MKTITKYRCECCKTEFAKEDDALKCEDSHKGVLRIVNVIYHPVKVDHTGYPIGIEVEMSDRKVIVYKRR